MHLFCSSVTSRLARMVGAIMLLLASSAAAHAVSITNRDDHEHRLTIIEGESRTDHVLQPSQTLTGVCQKGCTIRLDEDDEDDWYQLEADASVSIEDGILYFDADAPAGPAAPPASGGKSGGKG
jgi:hypothetical protein